uniref:Uncharacterized protein n=1 Tax=Avena sativa TaxID=4498 RepID=A0ACD5Z4R1_AVESA
MAADGANNELEEQLKDVGTRLQEAPDDSEGLLKLLDEVEEQLLKVEQSPPQSTFVAIRPAMTALVRGELLNHANDDVRLAIASCISEITRITAPEAPYEDSVMKDVFSIIVEAFQKLNDIESPSFGRRASILETVAKVRSCVVMLDLELDDLIRDMFKHFFTTMSLNLPETVISSMVTTMKLVLDESEEIQTALASYLLQKARKIEKEISPASFELAERVLSICDDEKLKPIFLELLQDQGTALDEYSNTVAVVCESDKVVTEDNTVDPSGKDTVDDGKLSERTISDELPQESSKLEQDVSCPEQDGTLTTAISSDATPLDNGEANQGPPSPKEKPGQSCNAENTKDVDQLKSGNTEGTESLDAKPKESSDVDSDEDINLKPCKSVATLHSNVDVDKEALIGSGELSADKKVVNGVADNASKPDESTPDVVKPKRGRPPGLKSLEKKAARNNQPSGLDLKKTEEATDSAGKLTKRSAKSDVKSSARKAGEGESSKKQQKLSLKQQKDETLSEEDTAKDLTLKEMVSPKSLTKGSGRTKGQSGDNSEVKRKREEDNEETPRARKNKGLDASLVGAKIKVWWPDDEMFYKGVVDSFDTHSKRHKVAYDDGDVEVLLLRDEKWDFISETEERSKTPDAPSEMRGRGRKGRGISMQPVKEEKTETPKSEGGELPKKRGRPKGWRPNNGGTPSSATSSKSKGKTATKDAKVTPKTGSELKKEGETGAKDKATDKTNDAGAKDSSKPKEVSSKGKDLKDESKSGDVPVKGRPVRKPKSPATPAAVVGSVKEKRKEKEEEAPEPEVEQEASVKASSTGTGKKRRRKA